MIRYLEILGFISSPAIFVAIVAIAVRSITLQLKWTVTHISRYALTNPIQFNTINTQAKKPLTEREVEEETMCLSERRICRNYIFYLAFCGPTLTKTNRDREREWERKSDKKNNRQTVSSEKKENNNKKIVHTRTHIDTQDYFKRTWTSAWEPKNLCSLMALRVCVSVLLLLLLFVWMQAQTNKFNYVLK